MPGNVEVSLSNNGWGGDFSIDATGDLVLAQDVPNNPVATQQRVYRLLMSNPRGFDQATNGPTSVPDDLFTPAYGGGLRRVTGLMMTSNIIGEVESAIYYGLQSDPTIVSLPPPVVTVQNAGSGVLQIDVSCTAVSGEIITVPSFPLPISGS